MSGTFTLNKQERLKSKKMIEAVFSKGKSISSLPLRVKYLIIDKSAHTPSPILFGVGVSTKYFKKAVERNRIKRYIREAYRLQKNNITTIINNKVLLLFFLYNDTKIADYKSFLIAMENCINKLNINVKKQVATSE